MDNIRKLLKNFLASLGGNLVAQILSFLALAYIARILGPEGYGAFSFAQSYIIYFLLFSDLGLSLFCIRESNKIDDLKKRNDFFNDIFTLKIYLSILNTVIYLISIYFIKRSSVEKDVLNLIAPTIIFTGIFIDYMFTAKNNMKHIGFSNCIKSALWYGLCVTYIKNESNVRLTSIFYSVITLVGSIYLIIIFNKLYSKLRIKKVRKKHILILKSAYPLALSLFMVQINNNFDIIYLGFEKSQQVVGYYSSAYKIINFLIAILTIYFNSSYSTIAELFIKNKRELSNFINKFYGIGILIITPIVFGGIVLSTKIIVFVFGIKFSNAGLLFLLLTPLIYIRMVTSTFGAVMIMGNKSKEFSKGVMFGAVINIILNIVLVPKFNAAGSAIATIISESIQGFYLFYCFRKDCKSHLIRISIIPMVGSIIMAFIINKLDYSLILSIFMGIIVYTLSIALLYLCHYYFKKSILYKR